MGLFTVIPSSYQVFHVISLTLFTNLVTWLTYFTREMYLALLGLLAVVKSNQEFRTLEEFCPYYQDIYINVSTSTLVSCAIYCHVQTLGCSRFAYDEVKEICLLYLSNHETNITPFRQSIFVSTCEGIYIYLRENTMQSNLLKRSPLLNSHLY